MPVHSLPYTVDRNGRFHGRSGRFVSTEEVFNCYREAKLEAETAQRIAEEAALKVAKAVEEQERAEAGSVVALENVSELKALLLQAGVGEPEPEYGGGGLATRRLWNLLKHDEANNKSGESSLENAIDTASEYKDLGGEHTNSRDAPVQGEGARQGAFALFVLYRLASLDLGVTRAGAGRRRSLRGVCALFDIASRPWTLASHAPLCPASLTRASSDGRQWLPRHSLCVFQLE